MADEEDGALMSTGISEDEIVALAMLSATRGVLSE